MKPLLKDIILISFSLLLSFFIYFNVLQSDFTNYDDDTHITKNEDVKSLDAKHIKKIFSSKYVGMYQPFTTLSFALEYKFFKLDPFYYHLHNLLLHLLNCLLIFWLIYYLTKRKSAAYICMLLFAVHPMHVESVAWITERKDVLYAFFYLLSLIFYLKFIDRSKYHYIFLSFLFFIFSCLSKSAAITLPVVLIVLELYRSRQKDRKLILAKIPFFLTAILFGVITLLSQGALEEKTGLVADYSIIERLVFASYSFFYYLYSFLIPFNLSAFHPYPIITGSTIPAVFYVMAGCTIIFIVTGWIFLKKSNDRQFILNVVLDFMLFLIPVLLILQVPVGSALVAERYTYLPYLGLSLFIFRLYDKYFTGLKSWAKYGIIVLAVLFMIMMLVVTYQRVKVWKNSYTLNDDIIRKHPKNASIAYNNRALASVERGDYTNALEDITKSIQQSVDFADAYQNRAFVKYKLNDPRGAILDYDYAIKLNPRNANWYVNRAISKELIQDYSGAIYDYSLAINLNPNYEKALLYRADDWYVLENYPNAIADLSRVIEINPNNTEAYTKRCFSFVKLNRLNEACRDCSYAAGLGDQTASQILQQHCR
jgi:Tfp pilus assembly protein PilF